jgi:hypothetical protein
MHAVAWLVAGVLLARGELAPVGLTSAQGVERNQPEQGAARGDEIRHSHLDRPAARITLSTTLTFAVPDPERWAEVSGGVGEWIPELGTDSRAALERELADSLLTIIDTSLAARGSVETDSAAEAQSAEVTSITEGRMDGHWPPVYYAFVDVRFEIDVYARESCLLKADQLRRLHGEAASSCGASVRAVADAMDATSAILDVELNDLDVCFTESCEDGYSNAEPRPAELQLNVEGRQLLSSALRAAAQVEL